MSDSTITFRTKADLSGARSLQTAYDALSRDEQKLIQTNIAMAQSYARVLASQGQAAKGAQFLATTYKGLSAAPAQSALALQQQISSLDRTAANAGKTFAGTLKSSLVSTASEAARTALAIGGTAAVVRGLIDAGKQAIALHETENALRAVSGSTKVYEDALRTARQQQLLFGGSLKDSIEGIQGLVITARDSGADLQALVDLSQRLNVKSPEQGIGGARVALAEAFGEGNITSLARRFEIPKAKIKELRDASIPAAEKVKILSDYLDNIGITSAAVAGKVDKNALAFRQAAADYEKAKIKLGEYLTVAAAPVAKGAANLFETGTTNPENTAQKGDIQAKLLRDAQSFEDYATRVQQVNQQLSDSLKDPLLAYFNRLETLTPAQYAFAQSLTATGVTQQAALAQTTALTDVQGAYDTALQAATRGANDYSASFTSLLPEMFAVAAQSQSNHEQVIALLGAYQQGAVSSTEFKIVLDALSASTERNALVSSEDAVMLAQIGPAAAGSVAGVLALDAALRGLGSQRQPLERIGGGGANSALGGIGTGKGPNLGSAKDILEPTLRRNEAIQDSENALALARAKNSKERIAILQRELGQTNDVVEKNRILAQIENERQSAARGSKRDPNARGLGALDKDTIALAGDERAQLAEVNRQLEAGNLTTHQRNQLLLKQKDLEEKIANEIERQQQARIDAQLANVRDQQERIKEARELTAARNILARPGEFSDEQKQLAALKVQEIELSQQKRQLDIAEKAKEGGISVAAAGIPPTLAGTGGAPLPAGATPSGGTTQPSGQAGIYLDGKQVGIVLFPQLLAMLASGGAQVAAAGG